MLFDRCMPNLVQHDGKIANVVSQGDAGNTAYIIFEGSLSVVVRNSDGSRAIIKKLGPGDVFGEFCLFDDGRRSADVATNGTEVSYVGFNAHDLQVIATTYPGFNDFLEKVKADRIPHSMRTSTNT